jgi:hypothetical protein
MIFLLFSYKEVFFCAGCKFTAAKQLPCRIPDHKAAGQNNEGHSTSAGGPFIYTSQFMTQKQVMTLGQHPIVVLCGTLTKRGRVACCPWYYFEMMLLLVFFFFFFVTIATTMLFCC